MNFDGFENIRYYSFEYDEQKCIENNVDYITDQTQYGYMADEVP